MNTVEGEEAALARELAGRIAAGDRSAEDEMVRRYGRQLEFILRRHVREPSLAADIAQEALMVVLKRMREPGLEHPEKLAAFLHRTAINLARGEARTYFRRNTHPDHEAVALVAVSEPLLADRIDREQLSATVRQLIAELGQPRDRELLRRFYLGEESKASLCEAFAVSPAHFDRIHFRAKQRFRQILESRAGAFLDGS